MATTGATRAKAPSVEAILDALHNHLGLPDQGTSTDGDTRERLARLRDLYRLHGTPLHEEVLLNELLQDLTASE
jgi:hypothetical protein